ncbi:hypothetical protein D3C77_564060 [compost metagenome]
MNYLNLFTGKGLMLIPIVVVSSAITLAIAAVSSNAVVRRRNVKHVVEGEVTKL